MRTIFITGATRGIGRATAMKFAREGWRVFGCGRDEEKISEVNADAQRENLALRVFRMDVTNREEIAQGYQYILQATNGEGVDVLMNNAGYQELGPVEDLTLDTWRWQFETNVYAMVTMVKLFVPFMRQKKSGCIINISSLAGRAAFPLYGAYAASKHAVEGMSDALRMELSRFGIRVVLVEPGPVVSNINNTGFANLAKNRPEQTVYQKSYDLGPKKLAFIEKMSKSTDLVVEKIYRAASARHPKRRYRVTRLATLGLFARLWLPGWVSDFIFKNAL